MENNGNEMIPSERSKKDFHSFKHISKKNSLYMITQNLFANLATSIEVSSQNTFEDLEKYTGPYSRN